MHMIQVASRASLRRGGSSAASMLSCSRSFVSVPREQRTAAPTQQGRGFVGLAPQRVHLEQPSLEKRLPSSRSKSDVAAAQGSAQDVDPADKWKQITVEMWRDAVYTNQTYFGELITDTQEFVKTIAEHIKLSGRRVSLVEVGCGTGEFTRACEADFRTVVGVDFNQEFIDFCNDHTTPRCKAKSHYLQGDACELNDLLVREFPNVGTPSGVEKKGRGGVEFWDDTRIVACVGNTIGIIPEELRPGVYQQMAEVADLDGVVLMVYWNARWFGDACLNFYHANPNLCGEFEGQNVDLKNTTLITPMNYKTKWTSVDEARETMESLGLEVISLREKGKGVFVAARRMK